MADFNLDEYKSVWKTQQPSYQYSEGQILDVLNHRSKNNVKYIVWIGILEFCFFLSLIVFYFFSGSKEDFSVLFKSLGISKSENYERNIEHYYLILQLITTLLSGVFMILFYTNYRAIKISSKLTAFIHQLLYFRRIVRMFIWINISLSCLFVLAGSWQLYRASESMGESQVQKILLLCLILISVTLFFAWLYYRIIYGILLRKLNKHLDQLLQIEKQLDHENPPNSSE